VLIVFPPYPALIAQDFAALEIMHLHWMQTVLTTKFGNIGYYYALTLWIEETGIYFAVLSHTTSHMCPPAVTTYAAIRYSNHMCVIQTVLAAELSEICDRFNWIAVWIDKTIHT
jgi:hypothetical protein